MYKTILRLNADYWSIIDMYGDYNKAINNAVSFVLQESLIDLPVSRASQEGDQISRTVTIVNLEYEDLHRQYGASRHISLRRIITYLIDNGYYDAFGETNKSFDNTLTHIETDKFIKLQNVGYKTYLMIQQFQDVCENVNKEGNKERFILLYKTLKEILEYYNEEYNTQSANRDNTIRIIRERFGTNLQTNRTSNGDD